MVVQSGQRDGPGIVGIGFASAASGQDSDFHCEGGRNVNDVLAPRDRICAMPRPKPFAPSIAYARSGHRWHYFTNAVAVPALTTNRRDPTVVPLRLTATAVNDELCGSIPMVTTWEYSFGRRSRTCLRWAS